MWVKSHPFIAGGFLSDRNGGQFGLDANLSMFGLKADRMCDMLILV